jgi:ABC-2 type transport system ATP-binding protein
MNTSLKNEPVVVVNNVSRVYGAKRALDQVCLEVPRGGVLGLVGANGAGKTTLIKHILGLLRAQTGMVWVFGHDPVEHAVEVLGRIGYLSEDRDLPPWMSIGELLRYSRAFYPAWDAEYAESLLRQFQLRREAVVRTLSKGELAKAGLLVALAHRPELLILDEPSSGLDPIVRRQLLEAVVRSVAEEGRTVLFSSHLLDEISRVSDRVAMVVDGRIVLQGPLNDILENHRRLVVRVPARSSQPAPWPGVLAMTGGPSEWTVICNGDASKFSAELARVQGEVLEEANATFEEIFHARAGHIQQNMGGAAPA